MTETATATRLEVRKDGRLFIGDLVWSDGDKWMAWQTSRTLKNLVASARCTFDGPIHRISDLREHGHKHVTVIV